MKDPGEIIRASIDAAESLLAQAGVLRAIARLIVDSLKDAGRVYLFGNGGSAADAQHLAAELVGRFERNRKPVPAVALTANPSVLTSVSNDYGFEHVFERQVEAFAGRADVVIGITTSGTSPNVVRALKAARRRGAATVLFTGAPWKKPGRTRDRACADRVLVVKSDSTARIQEAHMLAGHVICALVEEELFGEGHAQRG